MRKGIMLLASGAVFVFLQPTMAVAQEATAQQSERGEGASSDLLGTIVVTARKRNESAQDVPVSINAFSTEQLRSVGVTAAKDIVKITPGLQWKGDSPFGGNNVFLRGVGANTTEFTSSPAVAIYIDESYLNSQALQGFATFDLERVEVLKGPQGTLYGRNTTGGAIKYITRKPEIGAGLTGDISLDAGNFGLIKVEGGLGVDLGEKAALRVSFLSWDRGGIYHDYLRDAMTTDVNAKALRLQLLAEPSDRLSVLVSGSYGRSRSDDIRYKRVDTVDPATIDFGPEGPFFTGRCANPIVGTGPGCTSLLQLLGAGDDLERDAFKVQSDLTRSQVIERIETWGGALTVNYDFDFATLTSATSIYDLNMTAPQDVDGTAANLLTIFDNVDDTQWSQELRLTSSGSGPFKWTVGAYYFSEKLTQAKPVNIAPLGFGFGSRTAQKTDNVSFYAEGTYSLTPELDITLGGRWSYDRRKDDFFHFNYANDGVSQLVPYAQILADDAFLPGSFAADRKKSWSNFSGRAMISYKIQPDVMVYASFNRGFKAGEFNVGADRPETAQFVDPEMLNAYEVGFKSEFFDRMLRLNVAAFYYDYKDKQETLFDTGVALLSNADAEVKGFEIDLTARPFDGFTIAGGYSYLDAQYTDFPSCNPDGSSCDGNRLTSAPKHQLNVLARYEFELGGHTTALQVGAQHTSSRFFDYRNVSYIGDDAYWLFDARATFDISENLNVSAWVQNIANTRYFSDGYDVSVFGYSLLVPGTPRTYGGALTYRF